MRHKTAVMICSVFRPEKLKSAIESVPEQYPVAVFCWDKEQDLPRKTSREYMYHAMPDASLCERSWAATQTLDKYNIFGMCDDTKMFADTIRLAEEHLDNVFGDKSAEGVCGTQAFSLNAKEAAIPPYSFCLYGKEWVDRFPQRRMYCPDYTRFIVDKEWHLMAEAVERFTYCEKAMIYHLPEEGDKTHHLGDRRQAKMDDIAAWNRRRQAGLIWGLNDPEELRNG